MGEINRVFIHIDTYIDTGGGEHIDILSKVIGEAIKGAKRGYVDNDMEDQAFVDKIDATQARLDQLGAMTNVSDLEVLKRDFRDVAVEAMTCRRAVLPLVHPEKPWITLDPKKTLFDDEDQYSFAVYDTMADSIAKLLPELSQIACEIAWESDDDVD